MNSDPTLEHAELPTHTDPIKEHVFDGNICEYDKRLPNWWLTTFWGMIAFAFCYWVWSHEWKLAPEPTVALKEEMAENARIATRSSAVLTDDILWKMSEDRTVTQAGAATFATTCASCHMADLSGAIGPNLKDTQWIHGEHPMEVMNTITQGVLAKGMPTWGPILGKQKITELTAYIFSFHHQGEPAEKVPGWTPIAPGAPQVTQVTKQGAQ
jgi:cytochrome c oxidase cbb3-type subunit 3